MSVVSDRQELEKHDDIRLAALSREGNKDAFAELWNRHSKAAERAARSFTSVADPEDLVADAYIKIYTALQEGGGPTGAFRPYLFTTVRNLAKRMGRSERNISVDDFEALEVAEMPEDPAVLALDRSLTATAFRSLPERWQTVLWYTEVEGMEPQAVAPLLGLTANGVAALSYRAREGLRDAWLEAHITSNSSSEDCSWSLRNMRAYSQNRLTDRKRERLVEHLSGCAKCMIISEELDDVSSRLNIVVLPLVLGAAAGIAYNAFIQNGTAVFAATAAPIVGAGALGVTAAASTAAGSSAAVGSAASSAATASSISSGAAAGGAAAGGSAAGSSATVGTSTGMAAWVLPAAIVAGVAAVGGGIYGISALAGAGQDDDVVVAEEAPINPAPPVIPPTAIPKPSPSIEQSAPPEEVPLPEVPEEPVAEPEPVPAPIVVEPVVPDPVPTTEPEPEPTPVVPVPVKLATPDTQLTISGVPIFTAPSAQFVLMGTPGSGVWVSCEGPNEVCGTGPLTFASTGLPYAVVASDGTVTLVFSEWSSSWTGGSYKFAFGYEGQGESNSVTVSSS